MFSTLQQHCVLYSQQVCLNYSLGTKIKLLKVRYYHQMGILEICANLKDTFLPSFNSMMANLINTVEQLSQHSILLSLRKH